MPNKYTHGVAWYNEVDNNSGSIVAMLQTNQKFKW